MDLITLTTKTRGRNTREVEYKGVGRVEKDAEGNESVETTGVLTSVEEALGLPGIDGNLQKLLDFAVVGYNRFAREAALDVDEFAAFIKPDWDEKKADSFKRAVRALAKVADLSTEDAAAIVSAKMG